MQLRARSPVPVLAACSPVCNCRAAALCLQDNRRKALELQKEARDIIVEAARKKKIFTIYGKKGAYPEVRQALVDRGWIERPPPREDEPVTFKTNNNGVKVVRNKKNSFGTHQPASPAKGAAGSDLAIMMYIVYCILYPELF